MNIVLDTNVVVSGLLSPFGNPAEILRMVSSGELRLCFDARILSEYREVLHRPKFQFDRSRIHALLDQIEHCGQTVAPNPLPQSLPDPDDDPFLEAAIAGKVKCLVTGNMGHFPANMRSRVRVLSPAKFLAFYRKQMKST
ncbi:MAG: putative toxin-antitoxin system toxin component, PIN family [Kiritimatiellae bacterium]|nr:putative toxin-antitoxin system toxin component, PIN family [Kiritimatiellia bacterium]